MNDESSDITLTSPTPLHSDNQYAKRNTYKDYMAAFQKHIGLFFH